MVAFSLHATEIDKQKHKRRQHTLYIRIPWKQKRPTSLKAPRSPSKDLSGRQSLLVYLHTGNATTEVPPVCNPGAHSNWVISGQSYASNTSRSNKSISNKQPSDSSSIIVLSTDVLPSSIPNCATSHRGCETPSSSTCEAYKQRSWCDHPEVHAPAIRHVVEDGSRASQVFDPRQEGDGSPRV